ncbi:triose-phosphate isomerase [uncultured Friedmanniella sp.]|uniref:triose-phosphate isomerase n=1 Tax=uncultured Friedmanniella sp. TaxID=335381 RepID=UPI0035C9CB5A
MARMPLMVGNWKMNLNHVEAVGLVQKLAWTLEDKKYDRTRSEVVVLPPFTDIRTVQTLVEGDRLTLGFGAQDVSAHKSGAFTGEVSVEMLAKLNCGYVTIGHSERRKNHGESDDLVSRKVQRAVNGGVTPIICVGEDVEVREARHHVAYCLGQVNAALTDLSNEQIATVVIAYEPVWAIGTGAVATPEDAQEVCAAIRRLIGSRFTEPVAEQVRILYGGSVKANNVAAIMSQPDVDGCLVGGSSLIVDEFAAIARFYDLPAL